MLLSIKFGAALRGSDAYPEQFRTDKSMFSALISFTIATSYGISQGNMKDEDLKELWHPESVRHHLLYFPYR